ncbi:YbaB/EbfC family DNA-binding protein [Actinomadura sp. KC216]|nr:YbaB/EbfC family DNA-binding protein [Actinomadura sp. KC216]
MAIKSSPYFEVVHCWTGFHQVISSRHSVIFDPTCRMSGHYDCGHSFRRRWLNVAESYGFSESDVDAFAEETAKEIQKTAELRTRLSELVGRAESRDGRVRLGLAAEGAITELEIDPRAMRMASAELAETIVKASQDALQDLQRQARELTEDASVAPEDVADIVRDPQALEQQMRQLHEGFERALGDSLKLMDDLHRKMGR